MRTGLFAVTAVLAACEPAAPPPPQPVALSAAARDSIASAIQVESDRMLVAMRSRDADSVLAFYGRRTAIVFDGEIGDWDAIVAGARPQYATYTKVDCRWGDGFRIDVLGRTSAVVTGLLLCEKADTTGDTWSDDAARTEVLAREDGRWRIVALHESTLPGGAFR